MASNFKIQNSPSLSLQISQFFLKPMFLTFNFISRSTILPQFSASIPFNRLHCLSLSSSSSPISVSDNSSIEHPFEVSYLINTFGWPPEVAISKAKILNFETPEKPERMLAFLKKYGFTESQISRIIRRYPMVLVYNPDKIFSPKLGFLRSLGLSRTEVIAIVTKEPMILRVSLENILIPSFELIRDLVKSHAEAVRMIKRYPTALTHKAKVDNVQILVEEGMPGANLVAYMSYSRQYPVTPDLLRKMVEEVKIMGFDPSRISFLRALRAIRSLGKSNWEDKKQVLEKYGWSDREILLAFEKYPEFIMKSKDQIDGVMDFLVNIMGMEATDVLMFPTIMNRSLEKTIVPRGLVYLSLLEKGLCERKLSISTLCKYTEDRFITKFIKPYENDAPELWDIYDSPFTRT